MRLTLDTNVLLSATFWQGISSKIIELIEAKKHILILSNEIIDEYIDILKRDEILSKIINNELERKLTIQKLLSISEIITLGEHIDAVKEDPEDNKVIETAYYGKSDLIITQDKHLLNLKEYNGIKIINPLEFIKNY